MDDQRVREIAREKIDLVIAENKAAAGTTAQRTSDYLKGVANGFLKGDS